MKKRMLKGNFKYSISNNTKLACQLIKIGCMLYYFRIVRVYVFENRTPFIFIYLFVLYFFFSSTFRIRRKKKSTDVVYQSFLKRIESMKAMNFFSIWFIIIIYLLKKCSGIILSDNINPNIVSQ
jgi:hypothetical protein